MTPKDLYQQHCQQGLITPDPAQEAVLASFQHLHQALVQEQKKRSSWLSPLRKPRSLPGLYIWGGVGLGKTFLMDCFYQSLPFPQKQRLHFHQFMRFLHQELKTQQGKTDPLAQIAKDLAAKTQVLCFDELVVSDITDAMLLGRLFERLFNEGITLVATSNLSPDDLYKNGLQRQHFLPAIALLKKNLKVVHLQSAEDYRLRHLKQAGVFHVPNDEKAEALMEKTFQLLALGKTVSTSPLELYGREVQIKKTAGDLIWFDFKTLCGIPRSQQDYLVLAEKYRTIFLSDLPRLPSQARDRVNLFIRLIDVLYDARVRLILSAETVVEELYTQGQLLLDYARTCSRLREMQSESYFAGELISSLRGA